MPHEHFITSDSAGRAVITGTQVTVEAVLQALAASEAVDAILALHPELDRPAVQAALEFAAEKVHSAGQSSRTDVTQLLGEFDPRTPLAKRLWARRKAVIQEAVERGDPLLHSWEDVAQEVRERRGEYDMGEAQ